MAQRGNLYRVGAKRGRHAAEPDQWNQIRRHPLALAMSFSVIPRKELIRSKRRCDDRALTGRRATPDKLGRLP